MRSASLWHLEAAQKKKPFELTSLIVSDSAISFPTSCSIFAQQIQTEYVFANRTNLHVLSNTAGWFIPKGYRRHRSWENAQLLPSWLREIAVVWMFGPPILKTKTKTPKQIIVKLFELAEKIHGYSIHAVFARCVSPKSLNRRCFAFLCLINVCCPKP